MELFSEPLLAMLPKPGRIKIERLEADRMAAHAALSAADDRLWQSRRELEIMEASLRSKIEAAPGRRVYDDERARLGAPLTPKRAEVERLKAAHDRAQAGWEEYAFLSDVRDWLGERRLDGTKFCHLPVSAPKTRSPLDAVEKIRAELAELDSAWTEIEAAPAPITEMRQRMIEAVHAIAERDRPDFNARARVGDPARLADRFRLNTHPGGSIIGDGGASFFVWLLQDEIIKRVGILLSGSPQKDALSDDAREARFAEINARRLLLERQEEALIIAAASLGQRIARRRDADPRAVLEVEEV